MNETRAAALVALALLFCITCTLMMIVWRLFLLVNGV